MDLKAKEKLALVVKEARRGRSYRAYGKVLGVSGTTIQGWENMEYVPERENLAKIAVEAGYTLEELLEHLDGKSTPEPAPVDRILKQMRFMAPHEVKTIVKAGIDLLVSAS